MVSELSSEEIYSLLAISHVNRGGEPVSGHQVESMLGMARLCALVCVWHICACRCVRVFAVGEKSGGDDHVLGTKGWPR
jgi:hypothetical protein